MESKQSAMSFTKIKIPINAGQKSQASNCATELLQIITRRFKFMQGLLYNLQRLCFQWFLILPPLTILCIRIIPK